MVEVVRGYGGSCEWLFVEKIVIIYGVIFSRL